MPNATADLLFRNATIVALQNDGLQHNNNQLLRTAPADFLLSRT